MRSGWCVKVREWTSVENDYGSDVESVTSGTDVDLANQDYENMLVKYEASVRNHIKIEQRLKLHIECVQDKLGENEKNMGKYNAEREHEQTEMKVEHDELFSHITSKKDRQKDDCVGRTNSVHSKIDVND